MISGLLCVDKVRVWVVRWTLVVLLVVVGTSRSAQANSSALGGSLLEQGEVAITFGGGFPDAFVQFDFANSKRFNLAMKARANYNFGFPFFGLHAFVSAPMRINLMPISKKKLQFALSLEPGGFLGGSGIHGFHFGFLMGVGGLVSYQVNNKLNLYGGLDFQFHIGFEPDAGSTLNISGFARPTIGLHLPIEVVAGAEYTINENYALFGRVAIGPMIFAGNLGAILHPSATAVHGSARLWIGAVWRR